MFINFKIILHLQQKNVNPKYFFLPRFWLVYHAPRLLWRILKSLFHILNVKFCVKYNQISTLFHLVPIYVLLLQYILFFCSLLFMLFNSFNRDVIFLYHIIYRFLISMMYNIKQNKITRMISVRLLFVLYKILFYRFSKIPIRLQTIRK